MRNWTVNELAKEFNQLVAENKGDCPVDIRVFHRDETARFEWFFEITAVLDEAIEVGTVSVCGRDLEAGPTWPVVDGTGKELI